ncbi:MAG: RlmE family RNA methyltransferase [Pseudomonadales bacterium]|nr:RlmE family RNA methyltransferase [Pseudomonadales bacterium]
MSKRSKSSNRWLERQKRDYFVRQAKDKGQVSRAHYKLVQLDERFKLLSPRSKVLELGAAPGGWTQFLESRLSKGMLIAVDPLPITAGLDTFVLEGRAGEESVDAQIESILAAERLDLVLSDMAPNISGVRAVDQARSMDLADITLTACRRWLRPRGAMALKAFQGEGLDAWVRALRDEFRKVTLTKPKASRPESREVFVVAQGYTAKQDIVGGTE